MIQRVVCRRSHSPFLRDADLASEHISEILYGERADVLRESGDWLLLRHLVDGYEGWSPKADFAVAEAHAAATHLIAVPQTHVYQAADLKSPAHGWLPMLARVAVTALDGNWAETPDGWVYAAHLTPLEPETPHAYAGGGADMIAVARQFGRAPYRWGGRTVQGLDCSGLVQVTAASCGISLPRDSGPQLAALQRLPDGEMPKPGDIAGFPGHIGIMVDATHILHANATHMAITTDALADVIQWVATDLNRRGIHKPAFSGFYRLP